MIARAAGAAALLLAACTQGVRPGDPCSGGRAFAPWDDLRPAQPSGDGGEDADVGGAGTLIGAYQRHLRRPSLPGDGCPFYPTCSVFAQRAVAEYGAAGLVLVIDRLLFREHPTAGANYEETCIDGRWRWYDPVP